MILTNDKSSELKALLKRIDDAINGGEHAFSSLVRSTYFALGWTHDTAAAILDTSIPNFERWMRGKVIPPGATIILKFLYREVENEILLMSKDG